MEKISLVTGASRGIGRAIATELSRRGWAVAIGYRVRRDKAEELARQLTDRGCRAMICQADVSRRTLPLGGFFLPLTCVWEKRYECEITKQNRANEEITAEASIAALRKLREIIGTNESLVDKWVNCSMIDHEVLLAVATGERLVDIAEQIPSGAPTK